MVLRALFLIFAFLFSEGKSAFAISNESFSCQDSSVISPFESNFLEKISPIRPNPGPRTQYSAVYGKDNRTRISTEHPWRAIGKIMFDGDWHCTGTLVGSCYILTASHCLGKSDGSSYPLERLSFQASNNGPASAFKQLVRGEFQNSDLNDWAIVKLADNIGDQVGWLGVKNVTGPEQDFKGRHIIAGYNADLENGGQEATKDDEVFIRYYHNAANNLIFHNGNTYKGSSGAAIFQFDENNDPWIVGINTKAILLSDGSRVRQMYFKNEPKDWAKLATGVSTNQYWNEILLFMANNPCDSEKPLPPSKGK